MRSIHEKNTYPLSIINTTKTLIVLALPMTLCEQDQTPRKIQVEDPQTRLHLYRDRHSKVCAHREAITVPLAVGTSFSWGLFHYLQTVSTVQIPPHNPSHS